MKSSMILKNIEKERNFSGRRSSEAIKNFDRKVAESVEVVNFIEKKHKKRTAKLNARKNYVINLVTAAEVYFKDLIKIIPDSKIVKKKSSGLSELLDDQISIWDAYQLLRTRKSKKPVKIGEILASKHLFENLETIDSIFSKLLECNFLKDVEEHRHRLNKAEVKFFTVDELHLAVNLPDWRNQVGKLFERRHEFTHQICFKDKITYEEISKFWWRLICFVYAVNYFVEDKYLNTVSRKKIMKKTYGRRKRAAKRNKRKVRRRGA